MKGINKLITLVMLLLVAMTSLAQTSEVVTDYNPRSWTKPKYGESASLAKIVLTDFVTYVVIEVEAKKKFKHLQIFSGPNTHLLANGKKYPLLGIMGPDTKIRSCKYSDNIGWTDVKKGEVNSYILVFSGRIEPGITTISLVDKNSNGAHGYSFSNVRINNPKGNWNFPTDNSIEMEAKSLIDKNNDGIHGIYESLANNGCRVACIKGTDGQWRLLYIRDSHGMDWWHPGDLKAIMEKTASTGTFRASWIPANKWPDDNCTVRFFSDKFTANYNGTQETYMKIYPEAPTKPTTPKNPSKPAEEEIWTGTGWSLNENYIVTNYHVVDGAKTIFIKGINGDRNKATYATVVATDNKNDLAILKLSNVSVSGIPYGVLSNLAEVGEEVFVLGYPMTDTMGEEIKLTTGIVSSLSGFQGDVAYYQISVPIQPGNSGGPLFDHNGDVVGIVVAKHNGAELVSYAIKTSYLENLMLNSIGRNIFPTRNSISKLPLTEKVKAARKYVYYIMCSNTPNKVF